MDKYCNKEINKNGTLVFSESLMSMDIFMDTSLGIK